MLAGVSSLGLFTPRPVFDESPCLFFSLIVWDNTRWKRAWIQGTCRATDYSDGWAHWKEGRRTNAFWMNYTSCWRFLLFLLCHHANKYHVSHWFAHMRVSWCRNQSNLYHRICKCSKSHREIDTCEKIIFSLLLNLQSPSPRQKKNEWMNEWTNGTTERTNEWTNEWVNEWMNEWMKEWTNERTNERKNERTNERRD